MLHRCCGTPRRVVTVGAFFAVVAMSTGGCSPGRLSASSTCAAFNKASVQEQQQVVLTLYHNAHPSEPKQGMGALNAVMNVSYECGQQPSVKLGNLADFRQN